MASRPDPILIVGGGLGGAAADDNVVPWSWTGHDAPYRFDCLAWLYDGFAVPETQGVAA